MISLCYGISEECNRRGRMAFAGAEKAVFTRDKPALFFPPTTKVSAPVILQRISMNVVLSQLTASKIARDSL